MSGGENGYTGRCTECGAKYTFYPKPDRPREVGDEFKQQCFGCGAYGPTRLFEVVGK